MRRSTSVSSWFVRAAAVVVAGISFMAWAPPAARAADHGDAPGVGPDQGADIADIYAFLDPNDNNRVVLIGTTRGFIASGENVNFGIFDPNVEYRFQIEQTGDAKVDQIIAVRFSRKTSATDPQTATVTYGKKKGQSFTAPATLSTLTANPNDPVITTDPTTNITFFAGLVDDPFFFDIPGFNRFVASVLANNPDPTLLQRGRDSFAGYNIMAIAMSFPKAFLQGPDTATTIGVNFVTARGSQSVNKKAFGVVGKGKFVQVDRMGNPAVNVALIPFGRKDEYNFATTEDDAKGRFAADIVQRLQQLGTQQAQIDTLASVAVTNGDFLRLNLNTANSGPGGGNNAGAGFPNGRRLGDDVIDTLLTIIANNTPLGDNVNSSDVPLRDQFPFLAPPQQPRDSGVIDDNTRN